MLQHPWTELQVLIKEKWLTQKAFASVLWKKVSEVNELLKWKRNITIQRDYLLHKTLGTPIKYRILKQIDYDYSLLDVDENIENDQNIPSNNEEFMDDNSASWAESPSWEFSSHENNHSEHNEESGSLTDKKDTSEIEKPRKNIEETQESPAQENKSEADEDIQKRAKIFRSF